MNTDAGTVAKRLQNELMNLMMSNTKGVSAFPESDNMLFWKGTIEGPAGTVYEGFRYKISLKFPQNYPYSAPTVKFETPCYHPNVDLDTGSICLDVLKEKWSAVYNVQSILVSLQSLLGEPNNDSPLNTAAAQQWDDPGAFRKKLVETYRDPEKC
ncbi:ubiquitin-conjugating enzyme E2 [Paraphysoderma sedebokerense]|nr:ubiquitin-conjugating enzyme E2 [Paraphysoderma sedebokerense]